MTETTTAESNALVSLNLNLPAPTVVAEQVNKAFHTIYGKIEEEIAAFVPDVTTEKGRQAIASLAYKIARTKTGLDEAAKNVTADQKQIIDAVNAERSKMREDLDRLKATVRAPLDKWEAEEEAKKQRVADMMAAINAAEDEADGAKTEVIKAIMSRLNSFEITEAVYGNEADGLKEWLDEAYCRLSDKLIVQKKREDDEAELEQLRREKAEREEADRKRREEEEAAEAARIAEEKRKADEEAERARQEEERARIAREAEEKAAREAEEKIEAERRAKEQAERDRQEAEERHAKAIADAEAARIREAEEAKRREEEAAAKAEEDARRREEEAARKERERIQQEKAEEERQRLAQEKADQERAADLAHRKKVNSAATAAIMKAAGVSEADAQAIVVAIYKGQVPNVTISY